MTGKKKRTIILAIAAVLLALVVWTVWGNTALELNTYTVGSKELPDAFDGYRIAHVSDLHNAEMGDGNEKLLAVLREADPDIIAITGDLIDSRNTNIEVALAFAEKAMKIAPCYYVTGNHEARVSECAELKAGLEAAGVVVLENERGEIELSGETITILGVDDPSFMTGKIYTLTVHEVEQQELPERAFHDPNMEYPSHYLAMSYSLEPDISGRGFMIQDCTEGDRPRQKKRDPDEFAPVAFCNAAVIGVIGGADGPTSVIMGQSAPKLHAACSSLLFEPIVDDVEWRVVFSEKLMDDVDVDLI